MPEGFDTTVERDERGRAARLSFGRPQSPADFPCGCYQPPCCRRPEPGPKVCAACSRPVEGVAVRVEGGEEFYHFGCLVAAQGE